MCNCEEFIHICQYCYGQDDTRKVSATKEVVIDDIYLKVYDEIKPSDKLIESYDDNGEGFDYQEYGNQDELDRGCQELFNSLLMLCCALKSNLTLIETSIAPA